MPVTNPQAVRFVNEHIRPYSELLFDLFYAGEELIIAFDAVKSDFALDADAIDDKREAEGVSRLTVAEIKAVIGTVNTLKTYMSTRAKQLGKPRVRNSSVTRV